MPPFTRRRRSTLLSLFISPSWAHRRLFFFNAFSRLGQSAGGSLVSYGSAAFLVALDVAVALVQLPLALPGYIYTLLIGLAVGIVVACIAGKHQHFEFKFISLLEKLDIFSMASIITIPADKKEEDFPFPGGATFKLSVYFMILSSPQFLSDHLTLNRYKLSLGDLKELLRDYKQPVSGNKATVLLRLVDFSRNPAAWNEYATEISILLFSTNIDMYSGQSLVVDVLTRAPETFPTRHSLM